VRSVQVAEHVRPDHLLMRFDGHVQEHAERSSRKDSHTPSTLFIFYQSTSPARELSEAVNNSCCTLINLPEVTYISIQVIVWHFGTTYLSECLTLVGIPVSCGTQAHYARSCRTICSHFGRIG
jgi:hypothetical protein